MNESHETDAHQLALQRTDWLLDAFVLAFGVWTLICHGVVFGGGSLRHVLWGAGLATVAAVVVAVAWVRRCRAKGAGPEALGASGPEAGPALSALTQRRRWVVGAGVLLLLLALVSWRAAAIWAASLVVLVFLFVDPPQDHCARRCSASRGTSVALAVLCLVGVVFTLSAVRFDLDDAFYVNLAVAAADQPGAPLMAYDTLHGVAGMPLLLPVYRAHSYELLVGAVASVLGTEPRPLVFVVFPAIAAVLLTLAQGRLCRALLPNRWIWALAVIVAILVCSGGAHRSYGDFAFARLQQGKAILVSVCVPLVVVYALEFMHAPSVWRWLRLCLIQCVAIGVSSTGLWLAPLVAGVVLASRAISLPSLRRALTGLTASAYVVAVGLSMRSEVIAIRALRGIGQGTSDAAPQTFGEFFAGGERLLGEAYGQVFHSGATGPALLVALLVLAGLSRSPQLRRLVLAFAVAFLAFWCPLTAHWIKQHLVPNYSRVFRILPAPYIVAAA